MNQGCKSTGRPSRISDRNGPVHPKLRAVTARPGQDNLFGKSPGILAKHGLAHKNVWP